ncbi:MAG: DUF1501 domain-containing protein [Brachymonas sp.]|nr:DUF1501 domain-containing protein [Brachymonas sp.]
MTLIALRRIDQSGGVEMTDWWPHLGECADDISFVRSMFTTDNDHGLASRKLLELLIGQMPQDDNQPINLPRHQQGSTLQLIGQVPVSTHNERHIATLVQSDLDAFHQQGEIDTLHILNLNADRHRAARLQTFGGKIEPEIKPLYGL